MSMVAFSKPLTLLWTGAVELFRTLTLLEWCCGILSCGTKNKEAVVGWWNSPIIEMETDDIKLQCDHLWCEVSPAVGRDTKKIQRRDTYIKHLLPAWQEVENFLGLKELTGRRACMSTSPSQVGVLTTEADRYISWHSPCWALLLFTQNVTILSIYD